MPGFFISFILLLTTLTAGTAEAQARAPLDITAIKHVRITGEASRVEFTTANTVPYAAKITGRRTSWLSSWYSSWFPNSCDTETTTQLSDQTLLIHVAGSPLLSMSDCEVHISINLPKDGDVSINQHALYVRLSGDYHVIHIVGNAIDFVLNGHASSLDIKGDAVRSDMRFEHAGSNETITLDSRALDASFSFAPGTAISYAVDAKASFIDSKLASTSGAKPSIAIKGDYVRATIR